MFMVSRQVKTVLSSFKEDSRQSRKSNSTYLRSTGQSFWLLDTHISALVRACRHLVWNIAECLILQRLLAL